MQCGRRRKVGLNMGPAALRLPTRYLSLLLGCAAGLLAVYFMAYVLLGGTGIAHGREVRFFQTSWQARLFAPAARAESAWAGRPVETASWDG
jgi:hypothetical protein